MKLRILNDSLRLRMRRSEVEQLVAEGRVEAACVIGSRSLRYAIEMTDSPEIAADFDGNRITVRVPGEQANHWANSPHVGITARSAGLTILIEKDFVRSAVKEPDDYDRFTNPRTGRKPPETPNY